MVYDDVFYRSFVWHMPVDVIVCRRRSDDVMLWDYAVALLGGPWRLLIWCLPFLAIRVVSHCRLLSPVSPIVFGMPIHGM